MIQLIKDFKDFRKYKDAKMTEARIINEKYVNQWKFEEYLTTRLRSEYSYSYYDVTLVIEVNTCVNKIRIIDYSIEGYPREKNLYYIYHDRADDAGRKTIDAVLKKYGMEL